MYSNNKFNFIIFKTLLIAIIFSSHAFAAKISCQPGDKGQAPKHIAWFAGSKGAGFWTVVEKFMIAAAKDLGVTLEIYYALGPIEQVKQVEKVLNRKENPIDGVIFHNHKHRGLEILKRVEKKTIPAMLFNAGFNASLNVGKPREQYSCWIGSMLPDDKNAGYQLALALLNEAKKNPNMLHNNSIHMVALEGDRASNVSTLRMQGMHQALREWEQNRLNPPVVLHQSFHSKWRRNLASIAFKLSKSRYPHTTVFWTAADIMALGIIDEAKKTNLKAGKDFVTGGMDLLPSTYPYLASGEITASVGAHFIEGAFALIVLYDYLNGYDFINQGQTEFLTKMALGVGKQQHSLPANETVFQERLDKINFQSLSNAYKKQTLPYQFDTQSILNQLW